MFKKYLLFFTTLFIIVGCGNNTKVYNKIDLTNYLESSDMTKSFIDQGGDIRSRYTYFTNYTTDTVIVDYSQNQIIHHLTYSDNSNYTNIIHFNQNTIFNLENIPSQDRYKLLKKEFKSESTTTEELFEWIDGDKIKTGTSTTTKISICVYRKNKFIDLNNTKYEDDYLQKNCKLTSVTQYNIDSNILDNYPQLSNKNKKYTMEEVTTITTYEKDTGFIKKNIAKKININYCKNKKCSLHEVYSRTKYLLK